MRLERTAPSPAQPTAGALIARGLHPAIDGFYEGTGHVQSLFRRWDRAGAVDLLEDWADGLGCDVRVLARDCFQELAEYIVGHVAPAGDPNPSTNRSGRGMAILKSIMDRSRATSVGLTGLPLVTCEELDGIIKKYFEKMAAHVLRKVPPGEPDCFGNMSIFVIHLWNHAYDWAKGLPLEKVPRSVTTLLPLDMALRAFFHDYDKQTARMWHLISLWLMPIDTFKSTSPVPPMPLSRGKAIKCLKIMVAVLTSYSHPLNLEKVAVVQPYLEAFEYVHPSIVG